MPRRRQYKAGAARRMLRQYPEKWFGTTKIEQRDIGLLGAVPVNFVKYERSSPFVRKVVSKKPGEDFKQLDWVVEVDEEAKKLVAQAGGQLIGFGNDAIDKVDFQSMIVNVNIVGTNSSGFDWGYLTTSGNNVRVFKGPSESCSIHSWDAMILRDCTTNTSSLKDIPKITGRKWDILAMRCCEDFDRTLP
ncbi:hypothetical protein BJ878DRAFT_558037 [Calycina marina]|uniref:Uncharacterized protein n=1 Tax=Calycina marina TaxID=1763456 RepID=A0A9P7YWU0_9HELO|nr:hypothetical protein BJ878DRAFT_558037 [Calycina marina]